MQIHHKKEDSDFPGILVGIEIFDNKNTSVLKAGDFAINRSKLTDFKLEAGERLIGVKSGRRGKPKNKHYDVQFIVGKQVTV